jgi:transposase
MNAVLDDATPIGVGIDTARYGHRVTFLKADKQPAAPPLDMLESAAGYEQLRQELERIARREPAARFHVRIDAAGQYATNLEVFLRSLPLPLEISVGEPARNAAYRKVHFPKGKTDPVDSHAQARYAVVERPASTPATPPEFLALREVVGQLEAQAKQTTRLVNQLHNLLGRVFPELATLVTEVRSPWVLALLARYPTPELLARARPQSLAGIPYLKPEKAAQLQQAARCTIGSLRGEVAQTLVRESLREIDLSRSIEKRLHRLMRTAFDALPEGPHRLLTTIKGIGHATAAAIVAKVVSIERFATPDQLVSYFGVFPELNTSGYDRRGRPMPPGTMSMSRQGSDLVRRYLWMAAQTATLHNGPVRELFARQKSRGKRGDVALGHCMRKLLHQVFAVWKTGQAFDPQYPPRRRTARRPSPSVLAPQDPPQETQKATGHNEVKPRKKVVTAASSKVEGAGTAVNAPRVKIDYAALRRQITMQQVLENLGCLPQLKGSGTQRRGPCPIHASSHDRQRTFSASFDKHVFRCFHPECSAQGNVLDLWAAVHRLPLYEAALHLAQTFHLHITSNREEEPVPCPCKPR